MSTKLNSFCVALGQNLVDFVELQLRNNNTCLFNNFVFSIYSLCYVISCGVICLFVISFRNIQTLCFGIFKWHCINFVRIHNGIRFHLVTRSKAIVLFIQELRSCISKKIICRCTNSYHTKSITVNIFQFRNIRCFGWLCRFYNLHVINIHITGCTIITLEIESIEVHVIRHSDFVVEIFPLTFCCFPAGCRDTSRHIGIRLIATFNRNHLFVKIQ